MDLNLMVPYFSHEQKPQIGDPSPPIFGQVPISSCLCHRLSRFHPHKVLFTFYSPHPSKNAPQIHVNSHSIVHYILQPPSCKLDFWTSLHISIHALALSALSSSRVSPNLLLNHLWNHHFIQKTYKHCLYSTYPITVYPNSIPKIAINWLTSNKDPQLPSFALPKFHTEPQNVGSQRSF